MINWIMDNKEWFLSGLGITIFGGLVYMFDFIKNKKGESSNSVQTQKNVSNSEQTNIGVQNNYTVKHEEIPKADPSISVNQNKDDSEDDLKKKAYEFICLSKCQRATTGDIKDHLEIDIPKVAEILTRLRDIDGKIYTPYIRSDPNSPKCCWKKGGR